MSIPICTMLVSVPVSTMLLSVPACTMLVSVPVCTMLVPVLECLDAEEGANEFLIHVLETCDTDNAPNLSKSEAMSVLDYIMTT